MLRFVDLFAGIGGFHRALTNLGHRCVFASESDEVLRELYARNFPDAADVVYGDIRQTKELVPKHDILCAGFPCQPFSKSGAQAGFLDATRGTLFHEILEIVERHVPDVIILENVGNFARHDSGRTWEVVKGSLGELQYDVRGTEPKVMGGHGLISPHHFGFPHHRERFFIVATLWDLPDDPFPRPGGEAVPSLDDVVLDPSELRGGEREETRLSEHQIDAIQHWNRFLYSIPESVKLPSFPIWSDEFEASYPFEESVPLSTDPVVLGRSLGMSVNGSGPPGLKALKDRLPSYARKTSGVFPEWKRRFIRQNRAFYQEVKRYLPKGWLEQLREAFAPSLRKLEWNRQGEERDLWASVIQFRPSGIRAKRYSTIPALVAMTTTQIPILGPERRYLGRTEGLKLLGFPADTALPSAHTRAFSALGNSVHVDVVKKIAVSVLATAEAEGVSIGAS